VLSYETYPLVRDASKRQPAGGYRLKLNRRLAGFAALALDRQEPAPQVYGLLDGVFHRMSLSDTFLTWCHFRNLVAIGGKVDVPSKRNFLALLFSVFRLRRIHPFRLIQIVHTASRSILDILPLRGEPT
jgi:hypothetical protein